MPENSALVFFDLETQRSFQEVGGRHNLHLLRLSVAVTYNSGEGLFRRYTEANVPELVQELQAAGRVIGFNVLRFDYPVLAPYTPIPLSDLPTLDLLDYLCQRLGFRIGLDALARATLGLSKSADGLQAIDWWKAGEIEKLFAYCQQDVEVMRQLYEFGQNHHYVQYADSHRRLRRVPVMW